MEHDSLSGTCVYDQFIAYIGQHNTKKSQKENSSNSTNDGRRIKRWCIFYLIEYLFCTSIAYCNKDTKSWVHTVLNAKFDQMSETLANHVNC